MRSSSPPWAWCAASPTLNTSASADGRYYFLEVAARVGGAFIADVVEHATGLNLWAEWARVEISAMRGTSYALPPTREEHAGSVLCLAKTAIPTPSCSTLPKSSFA